MTLFKESSLQGDGQCHSKRRSRGEGVCPHFFFTPKIKPDMDRMLKILIHLSAILHNFPLNNLCVPISPFIFVYAKTNMKAAKCDDSDSNVQGDTDSQQYKLKPQLSLLPEMVQAVGYNTSRFGIIDLLDFFQSL